MKKPRRSTGRLLPVLVLTLAVLVCLGLYWNQPQLRAERFVAAHGAELEEALEGDGGIPARIGYKTYNLWGEDGEMAEFILSAWGDTYYGCYWSRQDVPMAFQGVDVPLSQSGDGRWTWTAEGDNHGVTWKLSGRWYYFEASF